VASDWNRRPWVIGTALDVWEIAAASRGFASHRIQRGQLRLTEEVARGHVAVRLVVPRAS